MKIRQLYEGLIDVPDSIIRDCERELLKFISTTITSETGIREEFTKRNPDTFKQYGIPFKNYGSRYDLTLETDDALVVEIEYDADNIKYAEVTGNTGTASFLFGVVRYKAKAGLLGIYMDKDDAVIINVYKLLTDMVSGLFVMMFPPTDDTIHDDSMQSALDDDMATIDTKVAEFMRTIDGTIKHEIQHHIQKQYFSKKQDYEKDVNSDDVTDYLTSDIEFHPTITSVLYSFKSLRGSSPDASREDFRTLFNYLTIASNEGQSPSKRFERNDYRSVLNDRPFFKALKDHKPKKWKIAVKYLYTELKDEGML